VSKKLIIISLGCIHYIWLFYLYADRIGKKEMKLEFVSKKLVFWNIDWSH